MRKHRGFRSFEGSAGSATAEEQYLFHPGQDQILLPPKEPANSLIALMISSGSLMPALGSIRCVENRTADVNKSVLLSVESVILPQVERFSQP